MSDTPERIWVQWPQPNGTGLAFSCQARPPALRQEYVRADIASDLLANHEENARILGYLVNELEGIVEAGKLGALALCLDRSQRAIAKAKGGDVGMTPRRWTEQGRGTPAQQCIGWPVLIIAMAAWAVAGLILGGIAG